MNRFVFAGLCTLIHIPAIIMRYAPFHRIVPPKRRGVLFAFYAIVLAFVFVGYTFFGERHTILSHKIILVTVALIISILNILFIPDHWREHLFTSGLTSIHISSTFFLCAYSVSRIFHIENTMRIISIGAFTSFIVFIILGNIFINSTKRVVTPFLDLKSDYYWKRVWFLPLPLFAAVFLSSPLNHYYDDIYSFIIRICILAATVLLCNSISEDHKYMEQRVKLAEQLNIRDEYLTHLSEHVVEARKARHDFKHHMAAIRRYIDTDDKSGISDYWDELNLHLSSDIEIPYTRNTALDGLIYRYSLIAKDNGITLDVTGTMKETVMSDADFSVLIGNALENALFGCLTVDSDRHISIQIRSEHEEQIILISNSYDGIVNVKNNSFLSRKRKNEPGIGIESMRSICQKNDAVMDIRYDDKTFSVLILIKLQKES